MLPIQDALLLTLVVGSMCVLILGDLAVYLKSHRGIAAAFGAWADAPYLRKIIQPLSFRAHADIPARKSLQCPAPPRTLAHAADLLVVDDSAVARAKLRRLFVGNGYSVQLAGDGIEALALLGKGQYALMITDLEMPNMDGIALIHACLRQSQTASMPIIAVSAHENLRAKFNECRDICGVHRKPWVDDILLSHVATLIGVRAPASADDGPRRGLQASR